MEKYAWKAKIKPGTIQEYKRRHDNLWQEIKDMFVEAGITNYTIWNSGDELFGYYECTKGVEHAMQVQKDSPFVQKWNVYMEDILIMEMQADGGQPKLNKVFEFPSKD